MRCSATLGSGCHPWYQARICSGVKSVDWGPLACRLMVSDSGIEAREVATERAVLRMVALGVPAAQTARFGYAGGWPQRLLGAFVD